MNYPHFEVIGISEVPHINPGDDVAHTLLEAADRDGIEFQELDVVVIASKAVASAEDRFVDLDKVVVSEAAQQLHQQVPRKLPAVCQLILDVTEGNVEVSDNGHIMGILPNGLHLTSGGVDKAGNGQAILLPEDPDASAARISGALEAQANRHIGVVISDSEGRRGRAGAAAVAVGSYGVPPLRQNAEGGGQETFCDLIANTGAIILGQRGTGMPFAIVRGLDYTWSPETKVSDILG